MFKLNRIKHIFMSLLKKIKLFSKKKKIQLPYLDDEFSFVDKERNIKHLTERVDYEVL